EVAQALAPGRFPRAQGADEVREDTPDASVRPGRFQRHGLVAAAGPDRNRWTFPVPQRAATGAADTPLAVPGGHIAGGGPAPVVGEPAAAGHLEHAGGRTPGGERAPEGVVLLAVHVCGLFA